MFNLTVGESIWLHLPIIQKLFVNSKRLFHGVSYYQAAVPTYPAGQIGFLICSNVDIDFAKPLRKFDQSFEQAKLKYYNSQIHTASFVLPQFAANALYN
jgi:spermidine synthase